ncbi:MAG: hypothetical protein JW860_13755 [Sedimentisphaerales bacterium]|nr:hypothetical protein [Sedimentisphaerales bacterium]
MDKGLFYLCVALSLSWIIYFLYLFTIDRQLHNIKRRLHARETTHD